MKSPGIIYRRYRQTKRKILYEKLQEAKKKSFKNCLYGKYVDIIDSNKIVPICVCLYNKDVNRGLDLCSNPFDCNAFIYKRSKKDIEEEFISDLKNPLIINKKYPELSCLEWVLDKTLEDAKKEPSIFVKIIVLIINILENAIKITANDRKRLTDYK